MLLAVTLPDFVSVCPVSQVSVERGMSWEEATHAWAEQNGPDDGFYVQVREGYKLALQPLNSLRLPFLFYYE